MNGIVTIVAVWGLGCYKPQIQPGLHCAPPPDKACPDGFSCFNTVCVASDTVGPIGSGGAGIGSGGKTGSGGMVGGSGGAGGQLREVGQTCTIVNRGQGALQTDDCVENAECVDDCAGASSRCYHLCQADADCVSFMSTCTRTVAGDPPHGICDVPFVGCDPIKNQACSASGTSCYLLSPEPAPAGAGGADRSVCDCSTNALAIDEPCADSRDCIVGLVCLPAGGAGAGTCQRICDPAAPTTGCRVGTTCHAFGAHWGYCYP